MGIPKKFGLPPIFSFFLGLTLSLAFLSVVVTPTGAAEVLPSVPTGVDSTQVAPDRFLPPSPPSTLPNFLGQNHDYTVTFRGNGEAIVSLKAVFANLNEKPLAQVSFRIPKVDPQDILVYQVLREPTCRRYDLEGAAPSEESELPGGVVSPSRPAKAVSCLEYQEPDYYQNYYGGNKYQKAKSEFKIDTLTVDLPQKVKPNASGNLIVYFRAFGYARKNLFGAYEFNFESLKVEDRIRRLGVGITTDADLFLRGAKAKVNYRFEEGDMALQSMKAEMGAVANPQFDNFVNQIGQGVITKTATNLQPVESYSVKGRFADAWLKLYGREISVGTTGVLIFLTLIFWVGKLLWRKMTRGGGVAKGPEKEAMAASGLSREGVSLVVSLGLSFLASILILAYTVLIVLFSRFLNSFYFSEFSTLLFIFVVIVSIGFYVLALLGPAIWLTLRRGLSWGLTTFGLTILWLILSLLAVVFFFFFFFQRNPYPFPMPMMGEMKSQTESVSPSR